MPEPDRKDSKAVWWIMGLIGMLLMALAGTVVNQQLNQVGQIITRLDSLDRRISTMEVRSATETASRVELNRRLTTIESDTREIREKIRKLY